MGESSSNYEVDNIINGGTPCPTGQGSYYNPSIHGHSDEGYEESYQQLSLPQSHPQGTLVSQSHIPQRTIPSLGSLCERQGHMNKTK